jgi:tRNA G46 methylase TrmB
MTSSNARSITTNQSGVHEDLKKVLARHKDSTFKRPIAPHTLAAFTAMIEWLGEWQGEVIFDACCGVGESTINLASEYVDAKVIGVDKSVSRLDKHKSYISKNTVSAKRNGKNADNYLLIQADLNDFWRLIHAHVSQKSPKWQVAKQFILYPNPYPKKAQLGKRWHASPLFPFIVGVCTNIEVRSNWHIYLEEFAEAANFYGLQGVIEELTLDANTEPYTPFERKYLAANQTCFKLVILPLGSDK